MSKVTTTADYTQRVTNAVQSIPPKERTGMFPQHERAYRLATMVNEGMVKLDGLTEDGNAALDALARLVKVDRSPAAAPTKTNGS